MDLHQETLTPNRRVSLISSVFVPTSNVSTNSPSTSDNQLSSISKAQPGIGLSSSSLSTPVSPMALDSAKPTDSQSSSSLIVNPGLQLQCDKCEHLLESNKSLVNKLSELESKHDEEIKEIRYKAEKELDQNLLEHRANLETVTKEEELRLKLVKSNEENISLKQENIKLLKNYTIQVKIQIDKYNELKELYDKKMETCSPITDLETLKIVHNKEIKELEEKLKKEYEKKLLDQRVDLEKKAKSKLDQLRKELTKFLDISIDTKAQPGKEIDKDEEVMIINESFASQSNKKKKKNNPTVPDCEPAQKKQKLSIPSIQSHASTDGPKGSLPSIGSWKDQQPNDFDSTESTRCSATTSCSYSSVESLIKSNDDLGYEIPEGYVPVRVCSICRWVEKIHNSNYKRHFKNVHHESLSKEAEIVNFENAIVPNSIYPSLRKKDSRSQISIQEIDSFKIPENHCFVLICRICRWIGTTNNTNYLSHWSNNHISSNIKRSIYFEFRIVIMDNVKYLKLQNEQKSQYQIASHKQPRSDNSTPKTNSKEKTPKSIPKSSNKSDSRGQRTGKKRSSQVPMKTRKSLRFQLN